MTPVLLLMPGAYYSCKVGQCSLICPGMILG